MHYRVFGQKDVSAIVLDALKKDVVIERRWSLKIVSGEELNE